MTAPGAPEPYTLDEVHQVHAGPGIYAWYAQFSFSRGDLRELLSSLAGTTGEAARAPIAAFLKGLLFEPLQEQPYAVQLTGPLKPTYRGQATHQAAISSALLDRLANDPNRLQALNQSLAVAVPYFASPIYIGLAKVSLRTRLRRHRGLMEAYWDSLPDPAAPPPDGVAAEDHSFARDVVARGIHPSRLRVHVMPLPGLDPATVVDAESILNRVDHRACGRN